MVALFFQLKKVPVVSVMQKFALLKLLLSAVFAILLICIFVTLHDLRRDFRLTGGILINFKHRLEQVEASVIQKRRVKAFLKAHQSEATDVEGRLAQVEQDAQQAHEMLLGFIYSKAPPEVRHFYVYSSELIELMIGQNQNSIIVARYIRNNLIVPPPPQFMLSQSPPQDLSRGNGPILQHIFRNKQKGFFIECGALDGTWLSNTFLLERLLNWTGLLIEADAINFKSLLEKKRNVAAIPTCLSRKSKPELVPFTFGMEAYSKIQTSGHVNLKTENVLCMPLYSILLAVNRTTVDLFSLDIEGHELDVLRTIPWDKVNIKVLIVEFLNIREGRRALEIFMDKKGYSIFPSTAEERGEGKWAQDDHIFVKRGIGLNERHP